MYRKIFFSAKMQLKHSKKTKVILFNLENRTASQGIQVRMLFRFVFEAKGIFMSRNVF